MCNYNKYITHKGCSLMEGGLTTLGGNDRGEPIGVSIPCALTHFYTSSKWTKEGYKQLGHTPSTQPQKRHRLG